MEKILITGANGYLGAQLCRHLSRRGFCITGLCYPAIPDDAHWQQQFDELVVCDVRDEAKLAKIADKKFDAIIHLVSLDHHQSNDNPSFVTSVNVTPTWNLLDIFSKNGLKKFIYFSTIHVYGKNLQAAINENNPLQCASPYALTHYLSENICNYYAQNSEVKCVIARLSNSYGAPVFPDNNCWWLVVNDLCRQAWLNKKIILQSDGSPLRDFIHGSDVCQAVDILLQKGENNTVYHLSSGKTYTILELAEIVQKVYRKLYGATIPVSTSAQENILDFKLFSAAPRYTVGNEKLQNVGFAPIYTIEKGIEELFDYLEKAANKMLGYV